jgi:hypothetical protein
MQQRGEIIDFAIQQRLPSMFNERGWAVAGGLMSYGENLAAMYRRAVIPLHVSSRIYAPTKRDSAGRSHKPSPGDHR